MCVALNAYPHSRSRFRLPGLAVLGFALILLAAASPRATAHDFAAGTIVVDHPWSRATPPGAKVAAGYAAIRNTGAEPDRLVAVEGEIAGRTEIHEMAVDANGVMTMRKVEGVEIPAGGQVELKPGGYHVMFLELARGAVAGETFKGSLTFEKAGRVDVEFAVEAMGSGQGGHGGHGG